jgi:hypothetical protein
MCVCVCVYLLQPAESSLHLSIEECSPVVCPSRWKVFSPLCNWRLLPKSRLYSPALLMFVHQRIPWSTYKHTYINWDQVCLCLQFDHVCGAADTLLHLQVIIWSLYNSPPTLPKEVTLRTIPTDLFSILGPTKVLGHPTQVVDPTILLYTK